MSQYGYDDDEPRRYRNVQTRPGRGPNEPDFVREETYIERGKGPGPGLRGSSDLVYRTREDSTEDIPRDFPPPGGRDRNYRRSTYRSDKSDYDRRSKSAGRGYNSDDYSSEDERYTQYSRSRAGTRRRHDRDYDSDYSNSPPRSTRSGPGERRKSGLEDVLGGLGLGGIAGALAGKKKNKDQGDDRSVRSGRARSRDASRTSRPRSLDDKHNREKKWAQAAQAALIAGAIEAFRNRKEPGPWNGEKGKRIATAALGAGGIDGILDRNPNEKTKRHLAEAVIGGLAANRLANGPRSKSRARDLSRGRSISPESYPRSRSRSIIDRFRGRSQSRPRSDAGAAGGSYGAWKPLAAGGALAVAGKAVYDRVRSKSRNRGSPSRDSSADSYVPSRNRRRNKRRSPASDTGARSMGGGQGQNRGQGQSREVGSRGIENGNNQGNAQNNGNGGGGGGGAGAVAKGGGAAAAAQGGEKKGSGNESESSSTTDMENKRKHMKGKELLTAGLATVATIHAVHGVYSSMAAHEKRHRLVAEGEMSPQEARKKQTKAWVQDAAAVGIAALGIKGAFSEWKEMNEHRYVALPHF